MFPVHSSKFVLANHPWKEPLSVITDHNEKNFHYPVVTPKIGELVSLKDSKQVFTIGGRESGNFVFDFSAKVFEAGTTGSGYDIYKDSAVMIHQPNVPGLAGNDGFRTKDDAEAVANLMITKLENGVMPPSITIQNWIV